MDFRVLDELNERMNEKKKHTQNFQLSLQQFRSTQSSNLNYAFILFNKLAIKMR